MGGVALVLAGILAFYGVSMPIGLGVILILTGVLVLVMGLVAGPPTTPALLAFLGGFIILGVVCSGITLIAHPFHGVSEIYKITTQEFSGAELRLFCGVNVGNVRLSFTTNDTVICRVTFTWSGVMGRPEIRFLNITRDRVLEVYSSATTANVEVVLGPNTVNTLHLATNTGNVRVDVPHYAKVRELLLESRVGNVEAYVTGAAHLRRLEAKTATGNVEIRMECRQLMNNCTISADTLLGNLEFNLALGRGVGCHLTASTGLGRVSADTEGFITLSKSARQCSVQTANYVQTAVRLEVTLTVGTGNLKLRATAP